MLFPCISNQLAMMQCHRTLGSRSPAAQCMSTVIPGGANLHAWKSRGSSHSKAWVHNMMFEDSARRSGLILTLNPADSTTRSYSRQGQMRAWLMLGRGKETYSTSSGDTHSQGFIAGNRVFAKGADRKQPIRQALTDHRGVSIRTDFSRSYCCCC